jgi:hypothetical protein
MEGARSVKNVNQFIKTYRLSIFLVVLTVMTLTTPASAGNTFYSGRDLLVWCTNYKAYMDKHGGQNVKFRNLPSDINSNLSKLFGMIDGVVAMKSGEDTPAKDRIQIPDGWRMVHLAQAVVSYVDERPQELAKPAGQLVYEALVLKFFVRL